MLFNSNNNNTYNKYNNKQMSSFFHLMKDSLLETPSSISPSSPPSPSLPLLLNTFHTGGNLLIWIILIHGLMTTYTMYPLYSFLNPSLHLLFLSLCIFPDQIIPCSQFIHISSNPAQSDPQSFNFPSSLSLFHI